LRLGILRGLERSVRPADEKSHLFFLQLNHTLFLSHAAGDPARPIDGATGAKNNMRNVSSGCYKKPAYDTRNNWVTMVFITHNRYRCFRKQSYIDTCTQAFHDLKRFGFEFGDIGFAMNHVHFLVNIPKRYSVETAEIMLKSYSSKKMFETFPGFRKRYPRGGFWSGYENYQSTGWKNLEQSSVYIRDQSRHHKVIIIDDRQQRLPTMAAPSEDAATPEGLAEETRRNGGL
jgi:REP element-mobilizing transposase RayT